MFVRVTVREEFKKTSIFDSHYKLHAGKPIEAGYEYGFG